MNSKFKEIARLFNLALNERFKLRFKDTELDFIFYFDKDGLKDICGDIWSNTAFDLLRGKYEVVKLPFKPKQGEYYFYIVDTDGNIDCLNWDGVGFDYKLFSMGNCFRTAEEALEHKDAVLKKFYEDMKSTMGTRFKDIAKMYNLELNERFKLKENGKVIVHNFYFCESGLRVEGSKDYFDTYLAKLLAGTLEVVKLPFDDTYFKKS